MIRLSHEVHLPTIWGDFYATSFDNAELKNNLLVRYGLIDNTKPIMVRIHSECITSEVFGSLRCDCQSQLHQSIELIKENGSGLIIYLRQEGRGIGLFNKIQSYHLQQNGLDTIDANLKLGFAVDLRSYKITVDLLKHLHINQVIIISNNPNKIKALTENGINVSGILNTTPLINEHNRNYIKTKHESLFHLYKTK